MGVALVWAAWALLGNLGAAPLQQYDEGTYAQVVHESFERGDFFTFSFNQIAWFEKPPLYFWLAGLATALTGDPVLGIRLPAALAGVFLIALVVLLVYEVSKSATAAAGAGALLVVTEPFVQGAREARLDVLVALFIVWALYCAWRRWYTWFGVAVALAVLSKSVIGIFAVVAAALLVGYLRDAQWLYNKKFWWGAIIGAAVVLPWHVYESALYGGQFWHDYLGVHVFERYETNLFGDPMLQTDYTAHLLAFAPLVTAFTAGALVLSGLWWRRASKEYRTVALACAGTAALMLLLFYTAQTRAFSYLLPVYPLASAFVALSFAKVVQD